MFFAFCVSDNTEHFLNVDDEVKRRKLDKIISKMLLKMCCVDFAVHSSDKDQKFSFPKPPRGVFCSVL